MTSAAPEATPADKRETIRVTLDFIRGQVDSVAEVVTAWRDEAGAGTPDKSDYRAVGRSVDTALWHIEKALRRLEAST